MRLFVIIILLLTCPGAQGITFAKRYGCETLFHVGNCAQLEKVHDVILQHLEQAQKGSDQREMAVLHGLACESSIALGQYKKALEYAQQGANLYKKLLNTTSGNVDLQLHYDYALVLYNEAQLNSNLMKDVSKTIECYEASVMQFLRWAELVAETKDFNSDNIQRLTYSEYILYQASAMLDLLAHNFSGAVEYFEKSLNHLKEIYPESPTSRFEYFQSLLMLSDVYSRVQNHEVAIRYAQQVISALEQSYGTENMYYVNALYFLGLNYYMLNDLAAAGEYLTRSMDTFEKTGHVIHADFALVLEALGNYFLNVADYTTAESLYDIALNVITYSCGDDCFHVYANRHLATFPMQFNKQYNKAAEQLEDIISQETFYSNLTSDHFICAYNSYIEIALLRRRYDDIFENVNMIEELIQELDGYENLNTCKLYTNIGRAYQRTGQYKEACRPFFKALELSREMTHRNFSFLPEEQRALFWERDKSRFESILRMNASTDNGNNDLAEILFDASLLQKSLQLNASVNMAQIIESKGSDDLKGRMRKLQLMMNSKYDSDEQKENECQQLERQIQEEVRKLGDFMDFANYTWQDVKKALGKDDVAIEFVSEIWTNGVNISAEILRSDMASPYHLHLFTYDESSISDDEIAEGLKKSVKDKLLKFLEPGDNVYFAPAGNIHKIPLEYMQMNDGKRMDELYQMHRVTSTRQLISDKNSENINKNIALFGGLNYNCSIEDMELQAMLLTGENRSKNNKTLWPYLPGTMKEVVSIAPLMESASYKVSLFTQEQGIEEELKALSESRTGIIHIATHGYYHPSSSNSLENSGLIFAGANNFWSSIQERSKNDVDDGVLTAKEISHLNLIGTDLVVLSACQTALGDISGEGVFGLQRAFKKAGVQSLLMSLWEVDDEATQVLMTAFYQNLANGYSKYESLKSAQDKVRNSNFIRNGEKVSGNDPYFWSAFVLVD